MLPPSSGAAFCRNEGKPANAGAGDGSEPAESAEPATERSTFLHVAKQTATCDDKSVGTTRATAYPLSLCFYNCCCCFLPSKYVGPWCGNKLCFRWAELGGVTLRRDRWLAIIHTVCFCVHTGFAIASFAAGAGKPMEVDIFRVVPSWNNTGRNGYDFAVKKDFQIRIDTVTGLFFLLSATFHGVWVFSSLDVRNYAWVWDRMISYIDDCFCFWRYVEYSLSASLMLMAIGMITGLRDGYSMFAVFMLSFTTMLLGIITEMLSRPCGPLKWRGDPDPEDHADDGCCSRYTRLRVRNYMWRMVPHFVGWVPYIAAWIIVISNFMRQIDDLPSAVRSRIPWFVPWAVYGTAFTFTSFAFVQMRYQWTAPEHYWRSEIVYAMLSLTAKLYLGGLLYWNVILAGSFEEAIALDNVGGSANATTMPLVQAWDQAVRVAKTLG